MLGGRISAYVLEREIRLMRETVMYAVSFCVDAVLSSAGGEDMIDIRSMICGGAFAMLITAPALADAEHGNGGNGNHFGWDKGGKGGVTHSAPGPQVGVGLAPLLIGGYLWYRRRSKQRK